MCSVDPMDPSDEAPSSRVKFLCSFGGSILPRPLDGRLRYVGGDTRIVGVPREISYGDLLARMVDLFEGPALIKYQQPDEDLDALVSVVNDDDLTNMLDEYDKLAAAGDGFTRLRIFLFPPNPSDDDRDTDRRYVDALNTSDHDLWLPPGAVVQENAGFPTNLAHAHNVFDSATTICEHCRMAFHRNQPALSYVRPHLEDMPNSCADCYDLNLDHRPDRGWALHHHHQHPHRIEDPRFGHLSANLRVGDPYIVDGIAMNAPFAHGSFYQGLQEPSNLRPATEVANEVFHAPQILGASPTTQLLGFEDTAVWYGNHPCTFGADNLYNLAPAPLQSLRRKPQIPVHPGFQYEPPGPMMPNGGTNSGFITSPQGGSPRLSRIAVENQIQRAAQNGNTSQKILGVDGLASPEYTYGPRVNQNIVPDPARCHPHLEIPLVEPYGMKHQETQSVVHMIPSPTEKLNLDFDSIKPNPSGDECHTAKLADANAIAAADTHGDVSVECFIPELIASIKKSALVSAETVEANANDNVSSVPNKMEPSVRKSEPGNACLELEAESDGDGEHQKISKIEPTTAEAEALAKGLQTIRNGDLEEIRELGSGTYGSVYHGKWKGSDVAIKRIKASCFAVRPSERERLIADFWKEALILSSLHHPNVVSFYGVVRDGPDGSLATVTEFMVNGSLKQFLQKKDRTIDRRKRLIIAMDAAFGMEYLHGKSIVHFDLKCENLLVNMRDPHRPVCKIGDLGLSKVKQHTLVSGGVRGTLPWMAPELLSGKSNMVSEKIDVYSFAIVMWEVLTGEEPYADMHCASVIGGIVNNTLRPQIPTWCDPEWKSLMESCWSSDPVQRPSFSEISQKLRKMSVAK